MGGCNARQRPAARCSKPMRIWRNRAKRSRLSPIGPSRPACSPDLGRRNAVRRSQRASMPSHEGRTMNLSRQTDAGVQFLISSPIIMGAFGMRGHWRAHRLWHGSPLKGYWPYLWREWLTSVDHKRIGVMYIVLALLMLVRGFTDAIMMRTQQAVAAGGSQGYLPPEHFDQIFSAHGTIMIFFVAMPLRDRIDELRRCRCNSVSAMWLFHVELSQPVAHRVRHPPDEHVARRSASSPRPAGLPIRR